MNSNRDKKYDHSGFSGEREQQNSNLSGLQGQGKIFFAVSFRTIHEWRD